MYAVVGANDPMPRVSKKLVTAPRPIASGLGASSLRLAAVRSNTAVKNTAMAESAIRRPPTILVAQRVSAAIFNPAIVSPLDRQLSTPIKRLQYARDEEQPDAEQPAAHWSTGA